MMSDSMLSSKTKRQNLDFPTRTLVTNSSRKSIGSPLSSSGQVVEFRQHTATRIVRALNKKNHVIIAEQAMEKCIQGKV